jgi:hypothetical protein
MQGEYNKQTKTRHITPEMVAEQEENFLAQIICDAPSTRSQSIQVYPDLKILSSVQRLAHDPPGYSTSARVGGQRRKYYTVCLFQRLRWHYNWVQVVYFNDFRIINLCSLFSEDSNDFMIVRKFYRDFLNPSKRLLGQDNLGMGKPARRELLLNVLQKGLPFR